MDSVRNPVKNINKVPQLYFKSLKQIYNARADPQNVNESLSSEFTFYKSALFHNLIVFFGKPGGLLKGSQVLRVFDLHNLKWGYIKVKDSSNLADSNENYSVCLTESKEIILCGHHQSNLVSVEKLFMEDGELKWEQDQGPAISCYAHHSANIFEEKMYVFGGVNRNDYLTNDLYEYSFVSKEWKKMNPKQKGPDSRCKHSTCIHQKKLFVFGGYSGSHSEYFNDIWCLDLETFVWAKTTPTTGLAPSINAPASICAFRQNILVFGGRDTNNDSNEIIFFDTDLEKWERVKLPTKIPPVKTSSSVLLFQNNEFILSDRYDFYKLPLDLPKIEENIEEFTFKKQMKDLFERIDCYDVIFQVEGKEIYAYKGILLSRSLYFAKMFASWSFLSPFFLIQIGGMKESQNQTIDVPDVKYDVFHKLIEYIYCDEIEISHDVAVDLLKLAHEYSLPSLVKRCGDSLVRTIDNDNFLELAKLAEMYQSKDLQEAILDFFTLFKSVILENVNIKDLPRELLEAYVQNS